jgi:hypothetical protein
MRHKFNVGQSVYPANSRVKNPDTYLIVQVLPETSYEPQYRVKGVSSGGEFVVCETQISSSRLSSGNAMSSMLPMERDNPVQVVWC